MRKRPPSRSNAPGTRVVLACALGLAVPLTAPVPLWAQSGDPAAKLQDVERKIQSQQAESDRQKARADALKADLASVTAELVQAAKRVQDQEAQVADLEGQLAGLEAEAQAKTRQLAQRREQFSGVVMALARMARVPAEALVVQPKPLEDTVRSAILLRAAVPAIETRAERLKGELDELSAARARVESRRAELNSAVDRLRAEESRIDVIRKRKAALRAEAISKSRAAESQARKLGREAKSLRDLMAKLEAERKRAEAEARAKAKLASKLHVQPQGAQRDGAAGGAVQTVLPDADLSKLGGINSISKARGRLPFPVVGRLVGLYGQPLDGGLTRKGVSIATRTGAQVIAPFDGKIVFAGPFRGYGQLLIIDHGEGYHSLLAGLGRIDAAIGLDVLAGEPVALMTADGGGVDSHPGDAPVLYVEFRRDNQPINPLPWLASRKGTPKG